jgi:hypothetical protein
VIYRPDDQNLYFDLEVYRGRTEVIRDTLHVFLEGAPRTMSAVPSPSPAEAKGTSGPPKSAAPVEVLKRENPPRTERLPFISNSGSKNDQSKSGSTPLSPSIFKPPQSNPTSGGPPATAALADTLEAPLQVPPVNSQIDGAALPTFLTQLPARIDQPVPTPKRASPAQTVLPQPRSGDPSVPRVNSYVPPQVLRRVSPHVTQDVRSRILSDVQVDVTVLIDANGKVTDARVTSTKGGLAGFVRNDAIIAARSFQFSPARENGHNIPSEMTVSFQFRR